MSVECPGAALYSHPKFEARRVRLLERARCMGIVEAGDIFDRKVMARWLAFETSFPEDVALAIVAASTLPKEEFAAHQRRHDAASGCNARANAMAQNVFSSPHARNVVDHLSDELASIRLRFRSGAEVALIGLDEATLAGGPVTGVMPGDVAFVFDPFAVESVTLVSDDPDLMAPSELAAADAQLVSDRPKRKRGRGRRKAPGRKDMEIAHEPV